MDISAIAQDLNRHALGYKIGRLQAIRKRLKNKKRLAGTDIFNEQTIDNDWAFHYGGRSELQFNIGKEEIHGHLCLRFGVAFSLEPSQTLPDISVLFPKIRRFNEFMRLYPDDFREYLTWYWIGANRTSLLEEKQIRAEFARKGVFAFFGKYVRAEEYSADNVLTTFDQLLPLFEYVEGPANAEPLVNTETKPFCFSGKVFQHVNATGYKQAELDIDVSIRHAVIQAALINRLIAQHGVENVLAEISSGIGNKVDVVVRSEKVYWYYEVKTGGTARTCIRDAIGQLLEYSYWPGAQNAVKLVVVGEPPLDSNAERYISELRNKFSIPITYEQQLSGHDLEKRG